MFEYNTRTQTPKFIWIEELQKRDAMPVRAKCNIVAKYHDLCLYFISIFTSKLDYVEIREIEIQFLWIIRNMSLGGGGIL